MKTNITLKMDSNLVHEAKVLAAQRGVSVSRLLADLLEELIRQDKDYERAKRRALARLEAGWDLGGPLSREEIYER